MVPVLIARAQAARQVMLAKWRRREWTMMEKLGKFGVGVAPCRRGEIPEEDFSSRATRDENGMHSVLCQDSLIVTAKTFHET